MSTLISLLIVWYVLYCAIGVVRKLTYKPPLEVGEQLFESFVVAFMSTMIVAGLQSALWE